jgi:hypothetical protein
MKIVSYLLLVFGTVLPLNACYSSPNYQILDKMVSIVRTMSGTKVCLNDDDSAKMELVVLLKKSGYDCCDLIIGVNGQYEDRVLVL